MAGAFSSCSFLQELLIALRASEQPSALPAELGGSGQTFQGARNLILKVYSPW